MNDLIKGFTTLINDMHDAKTPQELSAMLQKVCDSHMIEKIALSVISQSQVGSNAFMVMDSYPAEWIQRYLEQKYYLIDPVFYSPQSNDIFFSWHIEKFKDITPQQKKMLSEADDFGIRFGTTLSLLPVKGDRYFMTLLDANINNANALCEISSAANCYLKERQKMENAHMLNVLSEKQKEVLDLMKMGCPIKQMPDILKKDIATIRLRIASIKKKLKISSDQMMYLYGFHEGLREI